MEATPTPDMVPTLTPDMVSVRLQAPPEEEVKEEDVEEDVQSVGSSFTAATAASAAAAASVDVIAIIGTVGDSDPYGGAEALIPEPSAAVLASLDGYLPDLEPTVFNDDIKQPRGRHKSRTATTLGTKIGSISPRSKVENAQTDEERKEVLEKDRYLKKHPELLDLAQHMFLSALKHKPEEDPNAAPDAPPAVVSYLALTFFGQDNLAELEAVKKVSKERNRFLGD